MWIRIRIRTRLRYTGFTGNFFFMLLRNLPASAWQNVPLLRPEDISGMEGSMGEGQNVPVPTGILTIPKTAIFQSRVELHFE
jgi:hypothetical protein